MAKRKQKSALEKAMRKFWPQTRKEMDKIMKNTKDMMDKGEKYFRDVSERGIENTKKLALSFEREKVYYDLGKAVAQTPQTNWKKSRKVSSLMNQIKKLDREIKKIK